MAGVYNIDTTGAKSHPTTEGWTKVQPSEGNHPPQLPKFLKQLFNFSKFYIYFTYWPSKYLKIFFNFLKHCILHITLPKKDIIKKNKALADKWERHAQTNGLSIHAQTRIIDWLGIVYSLSRSLLISWIHVGPGQSLQLKRLGAGATCLFMSPK